MKKLILFTFFSISTIFSQDTEYLSVTFNLNISDFYCKMQSEPLQFIDSNKVEFLLKRGSYSFIFEKSGYRFHYETVNVVDNISKNIKLYKDPNSIVPYQSRGILNVGLNPIDSDLYINNQRVIKNNNYMLSIGTYNYLIRHENYESLDGQFQINKNDTTNISVTLNPITSILEINTIPKDNIRVYIDKQFAGRTPYINNVMLIGSYDISVRDENYLPHNLTVDVIKDEVNEINFELTSYYEYQKNQRYYWKKQKRFWGIMTIYFGTVSYLVNQSAEDTYTYNYMHSFAGKDISDARDKVNLYDGITNVAIAATITSVLSFTRSIFKEMRYPK